MLRRFTSLALMLAACGVPTGSTLQGGGTGDIAPAPQVEQRDLQSVPPLTGGTLIVTKDGLAVAADPERDLVWVADLQSGRVRGWLTLNVGDEPGRLVVDDAGLVHVALRRGGALVTFDPRADKLTVLHRRDVCAEPRGVTYDSGTKNVVVACATGEVVFAPADGSPITQKVQVARDLRDVFVLQGKLVLTQFRSAQVLTADMSGDVMDTTTLPSGHNTLGNVSPTTAWKTVVLPNSGQLAIVHHRSKSDVVNLSGSTSTNPTTPSPYGGNDGFSCPESIVESAVTIVGGTGTETRQAPLTSGSLPIDLAVDGTGFQLAVVTASPGKVSLFYAANVLEQPATGSCTPIERTIMEGSQPVAVAWWGPNAVVQTRDPVGLSMTNGRVISFPVQARQDRGFSLFHQQAGAPLACASCHAEGREDGHVWQFNPDGVRRTQALNGGLLRTAPFHWDGSLNDIGALMNEVFVHRMGGHQLSGDDVTALSGWLDKLPASAGLATVDQAAAARGKTLFESAAVGCASCHLGSRFTNNMTVDVGTGGRLQVPSLTGVSARGPWMHTGCAKTLRDRFNPACGGGDLHGITSTLSSTDVDDLVAYLQTL